MERGGSTYRRRMRPPVPLLLAAAVTSSVFAVPPSVAHPARSASVECEEQLQGEPTRAGRVERVAPSTFAAAAEVNDLSKTRLALLAEDDTLWLDRCGMAFYREPAVDLADVP